MTFADRVIQFNRDLIYTGPALPEGIRIMNPFRENGQAMKIAEVFYHKYYNDQEARSLILGINPGRFGAGLTGIPFTDPKRLISECGISYEGKLSHEPSSVFIYEMIHAFGGVEAFYRKFYINSPFPLGFTSATPDGREKNYNYYDSKVLESTVYDFIIENIAKQMAIGITTERCFCFGTGQNEKFLRRINKEHNFFGEIIALEHPRFIMQYKTANKQFYIDRYIRAFGETEVTKDSR